MCGQYYIEMDDADMRDIIKEAEQNLANVAQGEQLTIKTGLIRRTDIAPIRTAERIVAMKWGFSKDFGNKGVHVNARSETARTVPAFKKAMAANHCLVPASYYYEGQEVEGKKKKTQYTFCAPDRKILYLAAIYQYEADSAVPRFVILTREAPEPIATIHNRMPVIVPSEYARDWLGNGDAALEHAIENVEFALAT